MKANHPHPFAYGVDELRPPAGLDVLRAGLRRAVATLRLWRTRHRNRRELAALDARTLRDIGLTRGDAEFLINKPFWRK